MSHPTLYVCLFDNTPDYDTPSVWVYTSYTDALCKCAEEIQERCAEDVDEDSVDIRDLIAKGEQQAALELYAESCDAGRFVIIEERMADPEAIEHDDDPPLNLYREEPAKEGDRFLPIVWQGLAATVAASRPYERGNVLRGDSMFPATRYPDGTVMVVRADLCALDGCTETPIEGRKDPTIRLCALHGQTSIVDLSPPDHPTCRYCGHPVPPMGVSLQQGEDFDVTGQQRPRCQDTACVCPPDPVVTVTPVPKPYAAPSLKRIEPTEAIRAAFGPPQPSDAEVRAELLTAARAILAEHAAARQLGRFDALSHCHEAAMQLTIAIKDYLETLSPSEATP